MFLEVLKNILINDVPLIFAIAILGAILKGNTTLERSSIRALNAIIVTLFISAVVSEIDNVYRTLDHYTTVRFISLYIRNILYPVIAYEALFIKNGGFGNKHPIICIPCLINFLLYSTCFFTDFVFSITEANEVIYKPLAYTMEISSLFYIVLFLVLLTLDYIKEKASQPLIGITTVLFCAFSYVVEAFIIPGSSYSVFYTTIAIACIIYYFAMHMVITKKDALTGLYNRSTYYSHLKKYSKQISGIILLDMNGLKHVNDYEGHETGDKALSIIANSINDSTSKGHFLSYRIGGDEFTIIAINEREESIATAVNSIKEYLMKTKYSVSIGYSFTRDINPNIDKLLIDADRAMYKEKEVYYDTYGIK